MSDGRRVVVIGAGVIGASVAYHLAALGQRDVVILDRADGPGQGSTGRATGGFRAQYATADQRAALAARAGEAPPLRGGDRGRSGLRPAGYLWLAASAAELDVLRAGARGAARGGADRGGGGDARGDRADQSRDRARRRDRAARSAPPTDSSARCGSSRGISRPPRGWACDWCGSAEVTRAPAGRAGPAIVEVETARGPASPSMRW